MFREIKRFFFVLRWKRENRSWRNCRHKRKALERAIQREAWLRWMRK